MYFDIDINIIILKYINIINLFIISSISYYLNLLFYYFFMTLYLLLRYPDVQSRDDSQYERN